MYWLSYPGWGPLGLGTLATATATGNPDIQAIGSWARYPGLGTLGLGTLATATATGNPGFQG